MQTKMLGRRWKTAASTRQDGGGEDAEKESGDAESSSDATRYSTLIARINSLSMGRANLQFAAKEFCRAMSKPAAADWQKLKKIGRYLKESGRVIQTMEWNDGTNEAKIEQLDETRARIKIKATVDSDWAGCKRTRRSTSGGVLYVGPHVVKATQTVIALSSAEAEYYAAVRGAKELLGLEGLLGDTGFVTENTIETDANGAIGIISRRGLGKTRGIELAYLWIQDAFERQRFALRKIPGHLNPADLMTKPVKRELIDRHMESMHMRFAAGRADEAPNLNWLAKFEKIVCADDNHAIPPIYRQIPLTDPLAVNPRTVPLSPRGARVGSARLVA